jgi:preprotein translocase subunit SecA
MAKLGLRRPARGKAAGAPRDGDEQQVLRWCREVVMRVGASEDQMLALSDDEFPELTRSLRARLADGAELDSLLPEAFAAVREAATRTLGQRHYDVQVMGGAAVHKGRITEMLTGEGKTLMATLPAYLNALSGDGVHVMTANRYLARRDAEWMGPVYRFLGLEIGQLPEPGRRSEEARRAYGADVTYGTYWEFAYDFLTDNLVNHQSEGVQRGRHVAIVDEADLVLIDRARVPVTVTKGDEKASRWPTALAKVAAELQPGQHYRADRSRWTVALTDDGMRRVEDRLGIASLYDEPNQPLVHLVRHALSAREFCRRDRDYLVEDGRIVVIDATTGRPDPDSSFGDGLRQAVEAKEGLTVRTTTQTLARIEVWDYLCQYGRLSGMTGTAKMDAEIYRHVYGLNVVTIPTNRPMIRVDQRDVIFGATADKLTAIVEEAFERNAALQPVLIGTVSADQAEAVSRLLTDRGVRHEVLTAKNHDQEAAIIARAAHLGAVTVVAKMAGRGVDIVLGGGDPTEHDAVAKLGGLCVLGAERSVEWRLDMHLRGRAGRQGDPGESRFFMSLDDELVTKSMSSSELRVLRWAMKDPSLGAESTVQVSNRIRDEQTIIASWLAQSVDQDQVLADQRRLIYAEREALFGDPDGLHERIQHALGQMIVADQVAADARAVYGRKASELGAAAMRRAELAAALSVLDQAWQGHLQAMADLLSAIQARSRDGRAPLADYRREAGQLLDAMRDRVRQDIVKAILGLPKLTPMTGA